MMRNGWLGVLVMAALGVFLAGNPAVKARTPHGDVKEIEVTAKKFDFTPSEIHVKKGERVRLKITSTDRDHGIEISPYAEGADEGGEPGLKFDSGVKKPEFKLPKDAPQQIEFVADQPGTYDFKCSVFCGMGHRNMKGTIVVEP